MFALSFGQGSFNRPSTEQTIIMVIDPKKDYSSMDGFITKSFEFMNTDGEFYDDWDELYKGKTYTLASDSDIENMKNSINAMNQKVSILHETIIKAVQVVPSKWNEVVLGIETKTEYILYIWSTSA